MNKTQDKGYIIGGNSNSIISGCKTEENFGLSDFWILKLDLNGEIIWQKTLGGDKDEQLTTFFQTKDKEFIIGGSSNSSKSNIQLKSPTNGTDILVIKLGEQLDVIWQKMYNFGKIDVLNSLIQTNNDEYLLGGYAKSEIKIGANSKIKDDKGINDFIALKIDKDGNEIWQKTFGSNGADVIKKIIETNAGEYVLGGTSNPMQSCFIDYDYRTSSKKDVGFNKFFEENNSVNEKLESLKQEFKEELNSEITKNMNELKSMTGVSDDSPIKFKTNENSLTEGLLNNNSTTTKNQKKLPASGEKNNNFGDSDFWVIKLKDKEKKKKNSFEIEAYPNPTNQFTNVVIDYEFKTGTIIVVDLAGHVLQEFKTTEKINAINLASYPEGIYIVNVKTNVQENSVKIIKVNNSK